MRILNADEFELEKDAIIDEIINGAIFIYPTDTIYGIGCNAQDSGAVRKIRQLKGRVTNPFSVIAPSIEWVKENCNISKDGEKWLNKLPGQYTLIFKLKKECVSKEVNPGLKTLGVRIPKHWIGKVASEAATPIVTTSVNKANEEYMTSLEDIDPSINSIVDFILYEGKREGKPSKLVDLTGVAKVIER